MQPVYTAKELAQIERIRQRAIARAERKPKPKLFLERLNKSEYKYLVAAVGRELICKSTGITSAQSYSSDPCAEKMLVALDVSPQEHGVILRFAKMVADKQYKLS
jgi:hypothetical protein